MPSFLRLMSVAVLCLFSTGCGCLMGPWHEAEFVSKDHEELFFGYTTTPRERVILAAVHPETGELRGVDVTYTNEWASGVAYGIDWYRYNMPAKIPDEVWAPSEDRPGMLEARIIVGLTESQEFGRHAQTFNGSFAEYFDPLEDEHSLVDLMKHAGNGQEITVYAPDPRFDPRNIKPDFDFGSVPQLPVP